MCGIAGLFDTRGNATSSAPDAAHERRPAPSRSRTRGGYHFRAGRRARPPPPVHHRPRHRPAAAVQRGRLGGGGVQRRDLQLPGAGPRARGPGATSSTPAATPKSSSIHAWEAWGEDCVQRFRGMFAFALWDRNRDTFFMARDRLAVKPMFYALLPTARSPSAPSSKVLMAPGARPPHRPARGRGYFASATSPSRAPSSSAPKARPGRIAVHPPRPADPGAQAVLGRALHARQRHQPRRRQAELAERLRESVRLRMIAEVPLGAFLSGGSIRARWSPPWRGCRTARSTPAPSPSTIPSSTRRVRAEGRRPLSHEALRRDGQVRRLRPDRHLAALYDEPYADSSAIPTYRVCQLARKQVTVALSGDGGDETFGGYRRYRMHLMEEKMRAACCRRAPAGVRPARRVYPKADWAPRVFRAKTTFEAMARDSVEAYFHGGVAPARTDMRQRLFGRRFPPRAGRLRCARGLPPPRRAAGTDDALR